VQPSTDVTHLRSQCWYFAGSENTFLTFKATPATIKKLTTKTWHPLTKLKKETILDLDREENPSWWKPPKTSSTFVYTASMRFHKLPSEYEYLIYDPVTEQACYEFKGFEEAD
jgi:hypothetical protein